MAARWNLRKKFSSIVERVRKQFGSEPFDAKPSGLLERSKHDLFCSGHILGAQFGFLFAFGE